MNDDFKKGFLGFLGVLAAAGCSVGVFFIGNNLWVRYQFSQEIRERREMQNPDSQSPWKQCVLREKNELCSADILEGWPNCWSKATRKEVETICRNPANQR